MAVCLPSAPQQCGVALRVEACQHDNPFVLDKVIEPVRESSQQDAADIFVDRGADPRIAAYEMQPRVNRPNKLHPSPLALFSYH